jgi:hypothetical protein
MKYFVFSFLLSWFCIRAYPLSVCDGSVNFSRSVSMSFASLKTLGVAALAAVVFAGAAYAKGEVFTVKLSAPAAESRIVARATVWNCEGDTCVARPDHSASVSACRAFVREAGPVLSYGSAERQLDAEQLASCNESARVARGRSSTQEARN